MNPSYAIELTNISKSFPGVKALSDVELRVKKGEVHALVGENGAGKSTLIKVMTGFHKMDSGEMRIDGEAVSFDSPDQSIAAGIACSIRNCPLCPNWMWRRTFFWETGPSREN